MLQVRLAAVRLGLCENADWNQSIRGRQNELLSATSCTEWPCAANQLFRFPTLLSRSGSQTGRASQQNDPDDRRRRRLNFRKNWLVLVFLLYPALAGVCSAPANLSLNLTQ